MSATANATWKVFFRRSERPIASGLYPSSVAAARTRSTIAGLAPVPCSAREVEARETPARCATWISVARDDVTVVHLVVEGPSYWKRFQADDLDSPGNVSGLADTLAPARPGRQPPCTPRAEVELRFPGVEPRLY